MDSTSIPQVENKLNLPGEVALKSAQDFLKSSFHMFLFDEIYKVFKTRSDLISEISIPEYFLMPIKVSKISQRVSGSHLSKILAHALTKIQVMMSSLCNTRSSDVANFFNYHVEDNCVVSYLCQIS